MNIQLLLTELESLTRECSRGNICHPSIFVKNNKLFVSTEDGGLFADYYWKSWIDPRLIDIISKFDAHWEWQNPSCIVAVDN